MRTSTLRIDVIGLPVPYGYSTRKPAGAGRASFRAFLYVIVTPDALERTRVVLVEEPFLLIEGVLQRQDAVVSVRAQRMAPVDVADLAEVSHDFH